MLGISLTHSGRRLRKGGARRTYPRPRSLTHAHSHTHPTRLALLHPEAQLREYRTNLAALEQITGEKAHCMSHPCNSYNGATTAILRRLGVTLGFRANTSLAEFNELEYPREDQANILAEMGTCASPYSPATSLATSL